MSEALYRGECLLVRWSDSSRGGRTITLQIDGDGPHPFRGYEGERFAIMVVPIGNDEKPLKKNSALAQRQSTQSVQSDATDAGSTPVALPKSKGRKWNDMPLSQRAALLTKDPVFWQFLEDRKYTELCDEGRADNVLKTLCRVNSKAHIKPGTSAAHHYLGLESNFIAWKQAVQHGAM